MKRDDKVLLIVYCELLCVDSCKNWTENHQNLVKIEKNEIFFLFKRKKNNVLCKEKKIGFFFLKAKNVPSMKN